MGKRIIAFGLTAGLMAGGYYAANHMMPELGMPSIHNPFDSGPSDVDISGMRVTNQQLTGRVGAVVMGKAEITVESGRSTLTFEDSNLLDINPLHRIVRDGDATLIWGGSAKVEALPCLRVSDNFAKPFTAGTPGATGDVTAPISYEVVLGEGGTVTGLRIQRGPLDLCAPKITNTEGMTQRPDAVTEDGWLGTRVGEAERKTFVDTMVTVTEAVAMADSCPSKLVAGAEVDRQATRLVLGDIALRTDMPESLQQQVLKLAEKDDHITVTSVSDAVRTKHYSTLLNDALDEATKTTTTDPQYDDGKTHPLKINVAVNEFTVKGCVAKQPITLAAAP